MDLCKACGHEITIPPEPWSIGVGNVIYDANSNVVAIVNKDNVAMGKIARLIVAAPVMLAVLKLVQKQGASGNSVQVTEAIHLAKGGE